VSIRQVCCALALLLIASSLAFATDDNLTKGATHNHVFESGVWGENIDVLNGGLNLTIPIGPEYNISSDVSYQLKLSYSSKIWQLLVGASDDEGNAQNRARSRLTGLGQAGLGFTLQLGRYVKRVETPQCDYYSGDPVRWENVFEDATGATHVESNSDGDNSTRGSLNGTHLQVYPTLVQQTDGTRLVLGHSVADRIDPTGPNWPKCGEDGNGEDADLDTFTNDYRGNYVTAIEGRDRSGGVAYNRAEIAYETEAGMKHLMKSIKHYRNGAYWPNAATSVVTFENIKDDPTDANNPQLETGYVKSVTVSVFSSDPNVVTTATYTFHYTLADIWDPFVAWNDPNATYRAADNTNDKFEKTLLLTGITFPEGYTMSFEYEGTGWLGRNVGFLRKRTLPTGARIEYDFVGYNVNPELCQVNNYGVFCYDSFAGHTHHVIRKRLIPDPSVPIDQYTWNYFRNYQGLPNPDKTIVTDPYGNDTVTYFYVFKTTDFRPVQCVDNPALTCNLTNLYRLNGKPYKTEYYRGASTVSGNLIRTEEQAWDDDVVQGGPVDEYQHTGHFLRVPETRVIYNDDGGRTTRILREEYDGFGNYRKITEYGFDGLPYRIQRADYNCDIRQQDNSCFVPPRVLSSLSPAVSCPATNPGQFCPLNIAHQSNWVLGTYSYQQTEDPNGVVLTRSESLFDDVGYLKLHKERLTIPPGVTHLQVGDPATGTAGDVKTEWRYEGDPDCPAGGAEYPTGNVCYKKVSDYGATSGIFEEQYTYQFGPHLATRKLGSFSWKATDVDVDAATGLTRVSRDPNGIATTFQYDLLGRLKKVMPSGTEKEATLSYPDIRTTILEQKVSESDKIYSVFNFNNVGRLIRVDKRQADGLLSSQVTRYDFMGRVTFQSEWGDPNTDWSDPNTGTTYEYTDPLSDPANPAIDALGRVRKTRSADGKVTRADFNGLSSTVTVEGVQADFEPSAFQDAKTFYHRDAFGRLSEVISHRSFPPTGPPIRSGADAYYSYDSLDRLVSVRLESQDPNTFALTSQYRTFAYNALGQQLSATNPENGTVLNLSYDAAGNLLWRRDAMNREFKYVYDAASRLTNASGGVDPNSPITLNVYDQNGGVFGSGVGKLTTSTSYDAAGDPLVRQEFTHGGLNGRLSQVSWRIGRWNPSIPNIASQPELVMSYAYNNLGLISSISYPEKPALGRTVLNPQLAYANGSLTSVTDPNRGSLIQSVQYNLAGGVRSIKTRGDVETSITPDMRSRPSSITVKRVAPSPLVTHFDSGSHSYDGAGNITQIGDDKFAYDALNRLKRAKVNDTASAKIENLWWQYDPLGNMRSQLRQTTTTSGTTTAESWFSINGATNRIQHYGVTRTGGPPSDPNFPVEYDSKGNLSKDRNYEYVYDVLNRMTEVHVQSTGNPVAKYTYDSSGFRLTKFDNVTGQTTFYLRDGSGQTLSEFRRPDTPGVEPFWLKDYVYAAGRHVAMVENEDPAVPGGISVGSGWFGELLRTTLTWAQGPDLDLSGYTVEVMQTGGSPSTFNVTPATNRVFADTGVEEGVQYTYRIRSVDTAGRYSTWSEPIVVTPGDSQAPSSPSPVTPAVAGDSAVTLTWWPPADSDLWSFKILRRTAPTGSWSPISANLHKSQISFVDTTAQNNQEYDYQVTALDTSGLESAPVPVAPSWRVTPRDTTPPDVPQNLYAVPAAVTINLAWQASAAADVASYKIYRRSSPTAEWTLRNIQPGTTYQDTSVSPNQVYRYAVSAVDAAVPTINESSMSQDLVVTTVNDVVPKPTQTTFTWGYCSHSDNHGDCYLPQNSSSEFTHENWREFEASWTADASGATIKGFRLYRRKTTAEPFHLAREVWIPQSSQEFHRYPISEDITYPPPYAFQDNLYNPQDACTSTFLRVSALGQIGSDILESVMSDEAIPPVAHPAVLPAPENLEVALEVIDPNACTFCPATCSDGSICSASQRFNQQYYGLTLSWTPGGSDCLGALAGYHVYRSRNGGGVPIRITKETQPISIPVFRVDYLPLRGPQSSGKVPPEAFDGVSGYYDAACCGDEPGRVYVVSAVDIYGSKSALSNGVKAHTDKQEITSLTCNPFALPYNCESGLIVPDPNGVIDPNEPTGFTWTWNYGRVLPADVGPVSGNWVLAQWNAPSTGSVNDYRLLRKRTGESSFSEVTLDLIPGDDEGIRQFIWKMPLEMACEDANYAIRAIDLYGGPEDPNEAMSNIESEPKFKLRPENLRATAAGGTVTLTWDALPSCNGDLKGYSLMRSNSSYDNCSSPPGDSLFSATGQQISAPTTMLTHTPGDEPSSKRRWYRVVANWYDWTIDPNTMSNAVCISGDGQIASFDGPHTSPNVLEVASGVIEQNQLDLLEGSGYRLVGQSGGNNPAVKLFFYHVDHLGTPRVITDVSGNAISKHKYLPFGEELTPPPSTNTHEFTGHERDAETGLDYMKARYYGNGNSFRFNSVDPGEDIDFAVPTSWNKYAYVRNNPINSTDPTGLLGLEGGLIEEEFEAFNRPLSRRPLPVAAATVEAVAEGSSATATLSSYVGFGIAAIGFVTGHVEVATIGLGWAGVSGSVGTGFDFLAMFATPSTENQAQVLSDMLSAGTARGLTTLTLKATKGAADNIALDLARDLSAVPLGNMIRDLTVLGANLAQAQKHNKKKQRSMKPRSMQYLEDEEDANEAFSDKGRKMNERWNKGDCSR
jgi:RHS repeat-associated protein